ncbi:MAG: GDSL-type esterase/lipase family protein [Planctomycetia bacterium]
MDESSAKRSFPTGMVTLLGLGLIGIGLWYFAALQPVAVKAIPPTARADPGEARTLGRMERFDLPGGAAAPAEESAPPPAPDAGRWEEEVARYETAGREAPPAAGAVVLLGASNIRMWETLAADFPGLEVVNRGVGGCKLTELAGFAPRLLSAARPGVVVISAGSNDVHGGADAEAVLAAWHDVIATIRREHPTVPILVMGILPAKSRWEERETQTTANGLIQGAIAAAGGVIDGGTVEYLDVWGDFVGPDGTPDAEAFLDDDLHPSAIGNARRAARMRPVLDRLLSKGP